MKIVVGQGSCGIATGAKKTAAEFEKQLKANNLDTELTITGCVGTCYLEPIVDVYEDNGWMTRYVKVQPDKVEKITLKFEKGRCVAVNGKKMSPYQVMLLANKIGGRNGIGMKHALENRIIGTKSRGVYEAPGMEVLSWGLKYIYEGIMDRRSTKMFQELSKFVADQIYDGRWFDPATQAARAAIQVWADKATAEVTLGLYKGNIFFEALKGLKATIYNEADSSMEASNGLNPHSSQGFAEIQSVESKMLAKAGQIRV